MPDLLKMNKTIGFLIDLCMKRVAASSSIFFRVNCSLSSTAARASEF